MAHIEVRVARAFFWDGPGTAEDFFSVVLDINTTWQGWRTVWSAGPPSTPRQHKMSPGEKLTRPLPRKLPFNG